MKDLMNKFENLNGIGKVMICAGAAVAIVLVPVLVFLGKREKTWKWRKQPEVMEETVEV